MKNQNKTNQDCIIAFQVLNQVIDGLKLHQTKFAHAAERVIPRLKRIIEKYNEDLLSIQVDNAMTGEGGRLLKDTQVPAVFDNNNKMIKEAYVPYSYTADGEKKMAKEKKELLTKEVEFDPYYATEIPSQILENEGIVNLLKGFVIAEDFIIEKVETEKPIMEIAK